MITLSALALGLVLAKPPKAEKPVVETRPLVGDLQSGESLLKKAGGKLRVDGAWLNSSSDEAMLAKLQAGADGYPNIGDDNVLDRWDVLAYLRSKNTDVREMLMGGDTILVSDSTLDENAQERLRSRGKITTAAPETLRVFSIFKLKEDLNGDWSKLTYVGMKDTKSRDKLKKNTKVGYVVFTKVPGFRGGDYEAAFAVDKDIHLQHVVVRGPDGTLSPEVTQAAQRFVGKGARGQYEQLKASGAGKALADLEKPLSNAFLTAMEGVYMFEVQEREFFAFD